MHSKSAPKPSTISPIPMSPAPAPAPRLLPAPPSPPPRSFQFAWIHRSPPPSPSPRTLSPPLIAMIAVVGTAFLIVLYARLLSRPLRRHLRRRRRRRLSFLPSSPASGGDYHLYYHSSDASSHHQLSPYGLDDSAIGALPLALFSSTAKSPRDCAVCLLEFEDGEPLRSLPLCSHAFHVDCIDTWLRSHANCPLCRAAIFAVSPFPPLRAARIRPSFDDFLLLHPAPLPDLPPPDPDPPEIMPDLEDDRRDFLLTRSYSFGFERTAAAESSTTPWRYRHHRGGGGGLLWSKRWASPFIGASSSSRAARVFSFRSYRRSPFQRRRGSFLPLSESRAAPASRRTQSLTSPVAFFARAAPAASSRQRCGDPEALLSPERLNRR